MVSTRDAARPCPSCSAGRLFLAAESLQCDRCLHTEELVTPSDPDGAADGGESGPGEASPSVS